MADSSSSFVQLLLEGIRCFRSGESDHSAAESICAVQQSLGKLSVWNFSDRRLVSCMTSFLVLAAQAANRFSSDSAACAALDWCFCICDDGPFPLYGAVLPLTALCECFVSWRPHDSIAAVVRLAAGTVASVAFQSLLSTAATDCSRNDVLWTSVLHNLTALPDLLANALRDRARLPACVLPALYYTQVAQQVVGLFDCGPSCDKLLSMSMQKLASRAKPACLAIAWVHRCLQPECTGFGGDSANRFFAAALPDWRPRFLQSVILTALSHESNASADTLPVIQAVCGVKPGPAVHSSLVALLQRGSLPLHAVRACTNYLIHFFESEVSTGARNNVAACPTFLRAVPMDAVASEWSSRSFVDDIEAARQSSVSYFLQLCVTAAPLPLLQPELFSSAVVFSILEGVQVCLSVGGDQGFGYCDNSVRSID